MIFSSSESVHEKSFQCILFDALHPHSRAVTTELIISCTTRQRFEEVQTGHFILLQLSNNDMAPWFVKKIAFSV